MDISSESHDNETAAAIKYIIYGTFITAPQECEACSYAPKLTHCCSSLRSNKFDHLNYLIISALGAAMGESIKIFDMIDEDPGLTTAWGG